MSVRVVARIRPLLEKELDKDIIVRPDQTDAGAQSTIVKIPNPKNEGEDFSFAFNAVYGQDATQEELFTSEVAPYLKSLFQGFDVTLFAYGVTGTGKTHTMRGGLKLAERGVIPRLLSGIFRRGKKIMKESFGKTAVHVALSYYEIYNDKVFDLLEPPEKRTALGLPLRAEANGKTVVAGLTERACSDLKDFEKMYIEANNNRVTAATKLNAHSSRSHAILRVKVTQVSHDQTKESTISAIDLAGSEDNRRTDNGKERLVESAAINKSLFVLSQCIDAIGRGDKRIPYRESKMTRILSLGQNQGITVMILNLAPLRSYHLDTLSSLNVSSRAKRIEVREIENEVVFKQMPKQITSSKSNGGLRQPLRPKEHAYSTHNVSVNVAAKEKEKKEDVTRPIKAFDVYREQPKPTTTSLAAKPIANTSQIRRQTLSKRPSENDPISRPSKLARPTGSLIPPATPSISSFTSSSSMTVSAAQIEAMVEKKVSEVLAARAAAERLANEATVQIQPDANDAMQKRLEALERRLESDEWRDDVESDGLRFLLEARRHKERGEDYAALHAYELALPFFPGQVKLIGKIERLRMRLGLSPVRSPRSARKKRSPRVMTEEACYDTAEADVDEEVFATPTTNKSKASRLRTQATPPPPQPVFHDVTTSNGQDPQAQILLDIINSRDHEQIRALVGFGNKKANDLIDYLELAEQDNEEAGQIATLDELRMVPGLSGRVVERAYEGLLMSGV